MAHGNCKQPKEIGSRQRQRHREICGAGSVGLLLGFSFAIAAARHETRRELLVERQTQSARLRAGRCCCPKCTQLMSCGCFGNTFHFESKRIARRNFRIDSQPCANAALNFRTACGLRRSPLPQNARHQSPPLLLQASTKRLIGSDAHLCEAKPCPRRCLAASVMRGGLRLVAGQLSGGNFRTTLNS